MRSNAGRPSGSRPHAHINPPITLSELDGVRYLHFGSVWVQGAMRIRSPLKLEIEYIRQMMIWLLFLEGNCRILQLGLGAGALTRFCHARLPGSVTTVVERSPDVVRAVQQFFALPPEGPRLRLQIEDAGTYVQQAQDASHDVLQVDLYDEQARGPVLDSQAFYVDCHRVLAAPGIMTINLFGDGHGFSRSLRRIGRAFGGRVLALSATEAGNVVAIAFKGPELAVPWAQIEARAAWLKQNHAIEAPIWVQALKAGPFAGRRSFEV